jgi:hypothetical protein
VNTGLDAVRLERIGWAVNVATPVNADVPVTANVGIVTVPVKVGDAESALVATAVAMFANSVLISVPLTIFKGLPDASASLVAKFVVCV